MSESDRVQDKQREDDNQQLISTKLIDDNSDNDKFLTFEIKQEIYGLGINGVKEIIEYGQITKIPLAPKFIHGVINLRGNVVPIVDLAVRIGRTPIVPGKKSCVIIMELEQDGESTILGIIVDAVHEVVDILPDAIELAPSFGMDIRTEFIAGMGKVGEGFVVLLDIDKVLSIKELANYFGEVEE